MLEGPACLRDLEKALGRLREVRAAYAAAEGRPNPVTSPRPKLTLVKGGKDG